MKARPFQTTYDSHIELRSAGAANAPPLGPRGHDAPSIQRRRIYSSEKIAVNAAIVFFLRSSIMEARSHA
jgi:hypothetical protein